MASFMYYHTPCDTFVAAFDDKIGTERTIAEMDNMIQAMRKAANDHGFDLQVWGSWESMRRVMSDG